VAEKNQNDEFKKEVKSRIQGKEKMRMALLTPLPVLDASTVM
jgi:hypothetical protein